MSIPSLHSLLKKYGIVPKKRLGQHFLAAMPTMEKIVDALDIGRGDVVIEIGPGPGIMTSLVAHRASRVIAIEKDARLIDIARAEFSSIENITWIEGDILETGLPDLFSMSGSQVPGPGSRKIISNLPYNISSPILFWMLGQRAMISRAVVMLQKEVAMRIVAKPGTKDCGILSVLLQAYAECKKLFDVSAKSFIPPPEVASSVVRIDFRGGDCGIEDEVRFRAIVKAAFGQRRKMLRNALLGARDLGLLPLRLDAALAAAGIDPRLRPEALSVAEFIRLASLL